jgi:hypothetical protein
MIFFGSFNLFSTDALRSSSTELYALQAHLQLPAGDLTFVVVVDVFLVLIRSFDLDVISSSMETSL